MLLLDREISKKIKSEINTKVRLVFQEEKLDKNLCCLVGTYLGTTTTRATVEKAFNFSAAMYSEPNRQFFDHFSYDNASKILHNVEQSVQLNRENKKQDSEKPKILIDVRILKWQLLILSSKILKVNPDIKSTEDIVDSVLRLVLERFTTLFGSEEAIANG
jgi:hypothetical protein